MEIRILKEKIVDSTNRIAKEKFLQGEAEGLVVVADEQTAGRGRREHEFFSPARTGLYMSILVEPKIDPDKTIYIMPMAAVAVAEAIDELTVSSEHAKIKWVNDVYLRGKKTCGILVEGIYSTGRSALVVGVGVNVFEPEGGFPDDIKERAGAVFSEYIAEKKERLLNKIIEKFSEYYGEYDVEKILDEYRRKSCVIEQRIDVIDGNSSWSAIAKEIDEKGRLVVENIKGDSVILESEEISIRVV